MTCCLYDVDNECQYPSASRRNIKKIGSKSTHPHKHNSFPSPQLHKHRWLPPLQPQHPSSFGGGSTASVAACITSCVPTSLLYSSLCSVRAVGGVECLPSGTS